MTPLEIREKLIVYTIKEIKKNTEILFAVGELKVGDKLTLYVGAEGIITTSK